MLWVRNLGLNTRKAGIIITLISFVLIYSTCRIGW